MTCDDSRDVGVQTFSNTFRNKLPPQLYLPVDTVKQIEVFNNDVYGVKGLDKFVFNLR